jgi:hypothetical protein
LGTGTAAGFRFAGMTDVEVGDDMTADVSWGTRAGRAGTANAPSPFVVDFECVSVGTVAT